MSYAIRRATAADAALLAQHRAAVWVDAGGWSADDIGAHVPVWAAYFARALTEGNYVAWIAESDGVPVGSGALFIHAAIPRPSSESDRSGRVQSMYVVPSARRQGIARAIMHELLAYARARKLMELNLHPTEDGRPLYAALGFVPANEMRLRLTQR